MQVGGRAGRCSRPAACPGACRPPGRQAPRVRRTPAPGPPPPRTPARDARECRGSRRCSARTCEKPAVVAPAPRYGRVNVWVMKLADRLRPRYRLGVLPGKGEFVRGFAGSVGWIEADGRVRRPGAGGIG